MIRVLLIDDCAETRAQLRAIFVANGDVLLVGEAGLDRSARELLTTAVYDVVFLDGRLRTAEDVNLVAHVRPAAKIVFVADASERIVEAYEHASADFVIRPVQAAAMAGVFARWRAARCDRATPENADPYLPAKVGPIVRALRRGEIRTVVACENYTAVLLASNERVLVRRTMQQWTKLLPSPQFARVHRGLFVNLSRLAPLASTRRHGTKLHFNDGAPPLAIHRRHWPALRRHLAAWRGVMTLVVPDKEPPASSKPAASSRKVNPRAEWLVREGRHYWNLRTGDALARAEVAFVQALIVDPAFGEAHAGLAHVAIVRAMDRLADGEREVGDDLARARAEAQWALTLDPDSTEARVALAFGGFLGGNLEAAALELRGVLGSESLDATGYQFLAWILAAQGLLDAALQTYRAAIALDPLSAINLDRYAAMLALAGDYPAALSINQRAASLRPAVVLGNVSHRAPILLALGRVDEAVAAARLVRQTARGVPFRRNADADAIFTLRCAGLRAEAGEYATETLAGMNADNYLRGFVLAAIGSYEEALPALVDVPVIMLPHLYWAEMWRPLRHQPGFAEMIGRLGRSKEYEYSQQHALSA